VTVALSFNVSDALMPRTAPHDYAPPRCVDEPDNIGACRRNKWECLSISRQAV
jgi:hypothetical protein